MNTYAEGCMIYVNKLTRCFYPKRQKNYCAKKDNEDCPKLATTIYGFCGAECLKCGGEIIYKAMGIYQCIKCNFKIKEI
jgi:hypothetical protein